MSDPPGRPLKREELFMALRADAPSPSPDYLAGFAAAREMAAHCAETLKKYVSGSHVPVSADDIAQTIRSLLPPSPDPGARTGED